MLPDITHWLRKIVSTDPGPSVWEEPRWEPARKAFLKAREASDYVTLEAFARAFYDLLFEAEESGFEVEAFHNLCELIEVVGLVQLHHPLHAIANRRKLHTQPNGPNLHMIALRTIQAIEQRIQSPSSDFFWTSQPDDVKRRWPGLIYLGIEASRGPITSTDIRKAFMMDLEAERSTKP